jgi:glutathione synthase/RimK-type ligase-like ATP-grasp enzyme
MLKIYPYKIGSASVGKLKTTLDAMIIKLENSRYRYRAGHTIINWGNSRRPSWMSTDVPVLNSPEAVAIASNKLLTLEKLEGEGVPTIPFTAEESDADMWLQDGTKVYVRHSLTGHSGEGIEVVSGNSNARKMFAVQEAQRLLDEAGMEDEADDLDHVYSSLADYAPVVPTAPLYTMGIHNHGEYRVHVFNGEVILYQKKSRRVNEETGEVVTAEGEEADVRNLASNWVYRTGNLNRLERIEQLAINAVAALGLDFGAVDIIKDENGDVYVLECNTAPGLGNTETLLAYESAFTNLIS